MKHDSTKQRPLGFVKAIPFAVQQLDGSKAAMLIMRGNFDPQMQGTLSAVPHEDGMILRFVSIDSQGKEYPWPLSQAQADSIFINQQGAFEIPKLYSDPADPRP